MTSQERWKDGHVLRGVHCRRGLGLGELLDSLVDTACLRAATTAAVCYKGRASQGQSGPLMRPREDVRWTRALNEAW